MAILAWNGPIVTAIRNFEDMMNAWTAPGSDWEVTEVSAELRVNPDKPGRMAICRLASNRIGGGIMLVVLQNAKLPRYKHDGKGYGMVRGTYASRIFTLGGILHDDIA